MNFTAPSRGIAGGLAARARRGQPRCSVRALPRLLAGVGVLLAAAPAALATSPLPAGARPGPAPPLSPAVVAAAERERPDASASAAPKAPAPAAVSPAAASPAVPSGPWTALGPAAIGPGYLTGGGTYGGVNSGRITGLALIGGTGPHAGTLVAATAGGGLWTTTDAGATWTPRSDGAATLAIGSVASDPANPEHLIAGTGEANQSADSAAGLGVLSSTDGGQTWSLQDPGSVFDVRHIAAVAIAPGGGPMYAATDGGLYMTTDGGTTWAKPTDASYAAVDGRVTAVVVDPATPTTVYIAGGAAGLAKSTDGGATWAPANSGITVPASSTRPLVALALAPSSPGTLYAAVGTTGRLTVYKSTNGAGTWSKLTAAPDYTGQDYAYGGTGGSSQGWYDNVIAVDPTNADHVVAGGITLVETTNGGTSWTNVNGHVFSGDTNRFHPDFHALAFNADGTVWVGDDGGVFLYHPISGAVENRNGNLDITQFYFGFSAVAGDLLAGAQDNGSARSASPSLAWTGIYSGDGGPSAITPNQTQLQFIEADQSLFRSRDAFASDLTDITPPALGLFTPPMIVVPNPASPSNPTVFYGGPDVYRTTDPSDAPPAWAAVTSVGRFVSALAASPSDPSVVYAAFTDGTMQASTDGGKTFTSLAFEPFNVHFVTGISVDPANPKRITASFSYNDTRGQGGFAHVAQFAYTTAPGSGTWTAISGNLPAAVSRVVYDNGALVAATDTGVYATAAAAGTSTAWSPVGSGLPNVQVQDLVVGADGLYAVTHGRGAWRLAAGDEPPTAAYAPSTYTPAAGQTVSFNAAPSGDPDGMIASYRWVWGDGTPDGSGPAPTHTFSTPGLRSVGLYVTDSDGGTAAVGHGITVGDELPTVAYTPSTYTPPAGQTVAFRASAADPDGAIASYRWAWGDGTPDGSGATATHVFTVEGLHSVGLYVTDGDGQPAAAGHGITVGDELPTVAYTPTTYTPPAGQTVAFRASATDPDGAIATYRWAWGDGTPDGSGATATHVFTVEGLHSVGLYVTDGDGQTAAVGHGITVGDELPTVAYTPTTSTPIVGQTVTFTGNASDPDGTIASYRWAWGDGTPDGSSPTATHTFANPGLRSVGLYVTDSGGRANAVGHGITVSAAGGAGHRRSS